jgi:hypothetical protein
MGSNQLTTSTPLETTSVSINHTVDAAANPSHLYLIDLIHQMRRLLLCHVYYIMKNGANLNKDVETHIGNKQTPFRWLHG